MPRKKGYPGQTARHDMNLALDGELPASARASLDAHLEKSRAESEMWANMRTVDQLFSAEPMLQAPVDFAACVMSVIAAEKQPARQRNDLLAVIGLLLTVIVLLPLVLSTLIFV